MTKEELVQYLVNLHFLMEAQDKTAVPKSRTLADEYEKHWDMLKDAITKETENETRSSDTQQRRVNQNRTS